MSAAFGAPTPISSDEATLERNFDALIHPNDLRDWMKLLAARAKPCRLAARQGQRRPDPRLVQGLGLGRAHRDLLGALSQRRSVRRWSWSAPKPFKATLQEPPIPGDSSATATDPALPAYVDYQGDGDVTAGLVYVNYGMQDDYKMLAAAGCQRQRQDRHRALRRRLARVEAQARAGSRRDRMHHLLRPGGGRLFGRRDLSRRSDAPAPRHAARLGARHGSLSRRSADARASVRPRTPSV